MKPNAPDSSSPDSSARVSRLQRVVVAVAILVVGVIVALLVAEQRGMASEGTAEAARPLAVLVVLPEQAEGYEVRRSYTGAVRALRRSDLGFERGGRVAEVFVRAGQDVDSGAPLARLDQERMDASRVELVAARSAAGAQLQELEAGTRQEVVDAAAAQVAVLRSQRELAQRKLDRRRTLRADKQVTVEELDEAELGVKTLDARITGAVARLAELRAGPRAQVIAAQRARVSQLTAQIASLDVDIRKATLSAPFAGRIEVRAVDEGAVVGAGQSVVTLVESATPEVRVGVPPQHTAELSLGAQVDVLIAGMTYQAVLAHKLPRTDPATRTQPLVLTVDASSVKVLPGQVARLQLREFVSLPGYWVPSASLLRAPRGLWALYGVHEQDGSARVVRHIVEVLHADGGRTLVRGTLSDKDRIISGNVERVVVGQAVSIAGAE